MQELATATTVPDVDADVPERGRLRDAVLLSLAVTAVAALVALVPALLLDMRWSLAFVYLRWYIVFALLALPLVHQAARRAGRPFRLPWALRTPATALLLTAEGIIYDIVSSKLAG